MKKNQVIETVITDQGKTGDGIALVDDFPVYIPNCIPGDHVRIKIVKVDKRRAYGKLLAVLLASDDRVDPQCNVADQCGGCRLQHQSQPAQLQFKQSLMISRLRRFIDLDDDVIEDMIPADTQFEFRNKMQFSFGMLDGALQIGMYAARSHRVVDTHHCPIMAAPMNACLALIRDWHRDHPVAVFDEHTGHGVLRHLSIRYSYASNQMMVIVTAAADFDSKSLVDALSMRSDIHCIYVSIQSDPKNDAVIGESLTCVMDRHNDGKISDHVAGFNCRVSPLTFMQGNARMVDALYATLLTHLSCLSGPILDLYCGAGLLTMALAAQSESVIGVDYNESAIADAKHNAELNSLKIEYVCDRAEMFLQGYDCSNATVVMDPPRQGCHEAVVSAIISAQPAMIGIISCNVDTLGRDLRPLLDAGYRLEVIQGVEMFCHTPHLEMVVVLKKI